MVCQDMNTFVVMSETRAVDWPVKQALIATWIYPKLEIISHHNQMTECTVYMSLCPYLTSD